jgi:hypothetical protein
MLPTSKRFDGHFVQGISKKCTNNLGDDFGKKSDEFRSAPALAMALMGSLQYIPKACELRPVEPSVILKTKRGGKRTVTHYMVVVIGPK